MDIWADRQVVASQDSEQCRWVSKKTDRQVDRQTNRQKRQTNVQVETREMGIWADRQAVASQ
jgi:hypothetical protein